MTSVLTKFGSNLEFQVQTGQPFSGVEKEVAASAVLCAVLSTGPQTLTRLVAGLENGA